MSTDILNQMQDVKSQMDQFRLYLQVQQGRADDYRAQIENKVKNVNQSLNRISPLRVQQSIDKSRTTPKKPNQKKNFYTPINLPAISSTPKMKKRDEISNLLSTNDSSSSDEEIDSLLKEHRKNSGTQSPFKKYHFTSDSKASLSKYSISPEPSEKGSKADELSNSDSSTEISKGDIAFSDSDSSDSNSYRVRSTRASKKRKLRNKNVDDDDDDDDDDDKYSNKRKIIRSMKLVDQVLSETERKSKKVSKKKLKISKSFAVPYSGSYEEGEVYKIEEDGPFNDSDTDSDVAEFENFVPPIADEINQSSSESKNTEKLNSDEDKAIIKAEDILDVEVPVVDLNFLKDDENESKSDSDEENEVKHKENEDKNNSDKENKNDSDKQNENKNDSDKENKNDSDKENKNDSDKQNENKNDSDKQNENKNDSDKQNDNKNNLDKEIENKNDLDESEKESLDNLFDEMQTICAMLDNEEESE